MAEVFRVCARKSITLCLTWVAGAANPADLPSRVSPAGDIIAPALGLTPSSYENSSWKDFFRAEDPCSITYPELSEYLMGPALAGETSNSMLHSHLLTGSSQAHTLITS